MKTWKQKANPYTHSLCVNDVSLGILEERANSSGRKEHAFTLCSSIFGDGGSLYMATESLDEAKVAAEAWVADKYEQRASRYRTMSCMCENIVSELKCSAEEWHHGKA